MNFNGEYLLKCHALRVEFVQMNFDYKPLNLGQGLPDDLIPQYVIDTLSEISKEPVTTNNQYTRGFVS